MGNVQHELRQGMRHVPDGLHHGIIEKPPLIPWTTP